MPYSKKIGGLPFDPKKDIIDLSGKVFLITGGNAGLGFETIKHLIQAPKPPAQIFFTSRSAQKATKAIEELKATAPDANLVFLQCDLADLSSVQAAAKSFLAQSTRLDVLIANAGIFNVPPGLTKDGYEMHFGTNHMGHALLIRLLLPTLLATAERPGSDVRVVSVGSEAFRNVGTIDFAAVKTAMAPRLPVPMYGLVPYGQSKAANILYAKQLARRYPALTSVAVHPGTVTTAMVTSVGWPLQLFVEWATWLSGEAFLTPRDGALCETWAAAGRREGIESGGYYRPIGQAGKETRSIRHAELGERLWEWTEGELRRFLE